MAWASMHFAVGMACSGAGGAVACTVLRRGWRWLPGLMTLGGLWACVPDMPRLWRVDFPWLPFASTLGQMSLERWLHGVGDIFFFHRTLDAPPRHEFMLHGLFLIILLYNTAIVLLMWIESRQRKSTGNRVWRAHGMRIVHPGGLDADALQDANTSDPIPFSRGEGDNRQSRSA